MPGLRCCTSAFSSCGEWELLSCRAAPALGTQAQWLWHAGLGAPRLRGLPRPGIKPASPTLVGKFSCTGPSEKSSFFLSLFLTFLCQKAKISSAEYKRMTWNLLYYYYSVRCGAFSPESSTKTWLSWLLFWEYMIHISLNSRILFQVLK